MYLVSELSLIAKEIAEEVGVNGDLVCAIIHVESSWRICAMRYEANYQYTIDTKKHARFLGITEATEANLQKHSYGLMQIMGGTAREFGYKDWLPGLCDPEEGVVYGCKYLAKMVKKYENVSDQVAAYNAGAARRGADGLYGNQGYVNAVMAALIYMNPATRA